MERSWKTVVLLTLVFGSVFSKNALYFRLFEDERVTNTGDFETYNISWCRCAATCNQRESCVVWAWDTLSASCQIYTFLTATDTPTSAPPSLRTYGDTGGYFLLNTANGTYSTWLEGQGLCAARNAVIAFVGIEKMKLLLQTVRRTSAWVGLQLDTSNGLWKDHLGNVPQDLYWREGEPEAGYSYSYYERGFLATIGGDYSSDMTVLCAYT